MNNIRRFAIALVMAPVIAGLLGATAAAQSLPDPDGKPANMSKPVQVFIIMGQSNTLEMGRVGGDKDGTLEHAVKTKGLYPYLIDDEGNWTTRMDVRNVSVMVGRKGIYRNEWLTVNKKGKIGIEIGIGNQLGAALDAPVMILKSSIGNRALGWDLLPPGSESFEFTDGQGQVWVHAGYKESPLSGLTSVRPSRSSYCVGVAGAERSVPQSSGCACWGMALRPVAPATQCSRCKLIRDRLAHSAPRDAMWHARGGRCAARPM
jgi:hypothetical protein